MDETTIYALAILLALNVITFVLFGWDKVMSKGRKSRVSEARLLTHAFFGAFPGAKLGQYFFRHKTRKQPFARRLNAIGWVWVVMVGVALVYAFASGVEVAF